MDEPDPASPPQMPKDAPTPASPPSPGHSPPGHGPHGASHKGGALLALGALGVVYGDIGTSVLYALRECVNGPHGVPATPENILGVLSLIIWALAFVVSLKYLAFVLRADNKGEGGDLAMLALIVPGGVSKGAGRTARVSVFLALVGAALLLGDGMLTPAVTVLGAVEGLASGGTEHRGFVVPVTCGILIGLFLVQRRGTASVATFFGPAMLIWFVTIAAIGVPWIFRRPDVLAAVNPWHGISFFMRHGWHGFFLLGAVVLAVTGSEAAYADLGHFGKRPIRQAWFCVVWPALLINYFGQGALLLAKPAAAVHPFYGLVDARFVYPLTGLATVAAVIASQALISGVFSIARQAMQMGYLPRLNIRHTAAAMEGQIYIPEMNSLLMFGCLALVLEFKTSSALAAAYGIAVSAAMLITTALFYQALRRVFRWPTVPAVLLTMVFGTIDIALLSANVPKIAEGGWVPLAIAALAVAIMTTWHLGRETLNNRVNESTLPLTMFIADITLSRAVRVPGTAIFMSTLRRGTPNALLHHYKHNKVLHQRVLVLTITTADVPKVPAGDRVRVKSFGEGFYAVGAHFGFMETPDVGEILAALKPLGLDIPENNTSFFLGRETLVRAGGKTGLSAWRFRLFRFLTRNASSPTDFFGLPPNRVVEIGTQFTL